MKDLMKDFNTLQTTIVGFGQAIQTMRQVNVLEKFGFDVPDSLTKKIFFTFQDRFKKLGKMLGGDAGNLFTALFFVRSGMKFSIIKITRAASRKYQK